MDTIYNSQSQVNAIAVTDNQKWTLLDLLMILTLALYVSASLLPHDIGNCVQVSSISSDSASA